MADRDHDGGLGAFLKACRARLRPEDLGLTSYGGRRRVAGLRREELAQLAGVSTSYYARLEQGQSRHASPQVLDAIAAALELTAPERGHLHALAASAGRRRAVRPTSVEHPDPALLELLEAIPQVPALILGRRSDVLAWNPMGHALLAGNRDRDAVSVPGRRVNMTELVFLDPETRELYVDWDRKARAVVGNLRLVAGAHPGDPALAALIGRLTMASAEFSALWADHRVQACATAHYALHHPLIGDLAVTQQTLRSIERPDQTLVTCTAPSGSPSAEALSMLAHVAYPSEHPRPLGGTEEGSAARSEPLRLELGPLPVNQLPQHVSKEKKREVR
ncbi:helix-turn-helix transcriptional regulator [Streptomyces sp. NPDC002763]|uniref:helix-turn-helix domain-containing protein n=1 Tax=Streptomyces sp. NPDC002763 TaxID=3154427 RepID=UPI0033165F3C